MVIRLFDDTHTLARAAADQATNAIRASIARSGQARIIVATGNSQLEFLNALASKTDIAWDRVVLFHLDEYIGLAPDHPASFCKYIQERLINKTAIREYHFLYGNADPREVMSRVGRALSHSPIDVAFVGIGENGHLAFNDPPADFETEQPYIVVRLDERCRQQQVGEGWFANLAAVPTEAISMSIPQILKSNEIICVVPDSRKAKAVQACIEDGVSPLAPGSILQTHPNVTVYLDRESASLLNAKALSVRSASESGPT